MATVSIAVVAVVVLLLLGLVIVLQRRVHRLDREVALLRSALDRPQAAGPAARPAPQPHGVRSGSTGNDDPVAIITGLQDGRARQSEEPSLSQVVSVTVAGPMIKVVSLAHGVRRALDEESRMRIGYAFRRELRRRRREQRQGSARAAPPERPPGVWP